MDGLMTQITQPDDNNIQRFLYENFFDREVEIVVEGRVIHRGFFRSCKEKDFYFIVCLNKRKNERGGIVFVPFPFKTTYNEDSIQLSYKLSDFSRERRFFDFFKKKINQDNLRKYNFFNNIVTIRKYTLPEA